MSPRIDVRSILNPIPEIMEQKPIAIAMKGPPLPSPPLTDSSVTTPRVVMNQGNGYTAQVTYKSTTSIHI